MHTPTAFILRCAASPCRRCLLLPLSPDTPLRHLSHPLTARSHTLSLSPSFFLSFSFSFSLSRAILTFPSSSFAALLSFFLRYSRRIFTLLQLQLNSRYCYFLWWFPVKETRKLSFLVHLSLFRFKRKIHIHNIYIHIRVHVQHTQYMRTHTYIYIFIFCICIRNTCLIVL